MSKKPKTRLTLDLTETEVQRVKDLQELYGEASQAAVLRAAICRDLYLAQQVKVGGKIQILKEDGSIEIVIFPELMLQISSIHIK